MLTASIVGARLRLEVQGGLLYNRYQADAIRIRKYEKTAPYAYLIAQQQRDPIAPVELLKRLAFNGVSIHQLTTPAALDGTTWPAGTWVIPMNQPFAALARQLLDVQVYPDLREFPEGPPEQPYDAPLTLSHQMDYVRVAEASAPLTAEFQSCDEPLGAAVPTATSTSAIPHLRRVPDCFDTTPWRAAIRPPLESYRRGPRWRDAPAQRFRAVNEACKLAHCPFEVVNRDATDPSGRATSSRHSRGAADRLVGPSRCARRCYQPDRSPPATTACTSHDGHHGRVWTSGARTTGRFATLGMPMLNPVPSRAIRRLLSRTKHTAPSTIPEGPFAAIQGGPARWASVHSTSLCATVARSSA